MTDLTASLKSTLAALVAVDTTSARPNAPLVALAEARLRAAGFVCQRLAYRDEAGVEKVNMVARRGGDGLPALALVGHTDCVPYDPAWADALRLTEREGLLYGRGACDTKAFVAAMLHAVERVGAGRQREPLLVVLTADEEVGCLGAKHLVEAGLGRARAAIVGEPTRLTPIRAHKGYCLAEVEVLGQEGHSAFPDTGASAIFRAGRFLSRLEALALGPLRVQQDANFAPPYTTVNVGVIQGGKAKNIIAGSCRFTVEWRPIPGQPIEHVLEELRALRDQLAREPGGFEARVEMLRFDPPVDTPPDAPVVRFLEEQSGNAAATVPFGTEAPQLTELGAQAVVFGPGDIRVAHQTGEHVPLEQLVRCEAILERAIERFCG